MLADQEVYTVEGLAQENELLAVQQALVQHGGSQCGYCTPGFVMSMFAEYYRPDRQDFHLEALSGNLCRCTGYRPICDAALSLGQAAADDPFMQRLQHPAPSLPAIEYQAEQGRFYRPVTLSACFQILRKHPEAILIAGGTDLVVEANLRYRRWSVLVSLESIPELQCFHETPTHLEIGAGLCLSTIAQQLQTIPEKPALLTQLFPLFASPLIRNRATLGGNLVTASPIGDALPVLLALEATLKLASAQGERQLPVHQFFIDYRKTALRPGEVVVSVLLPKPFLPLGRFYKVAKRPLNDISTISATFALALDTTNKVKQVRVAYGGVAPTPIRIYQAEEALLGQVWTLDAVRQTQQILAQVVHPISDHRGSAAYRAAMAQTLLEKFYWETQEIEGCVV
jgi:xanthine dehydrogenase small subunit